MKRISIFVLVAVLTACATPAERRSYAPDLVSDSNKPAKQVALCVSEKWENTKPLFGFTSPPVNLTMRSYGYAITATVITSLGSTSTIVLIDIFEQQDRCYVKFYKGSGGGFGAYENVVKECI